jgi:DNA invertase Pin-like site-specific DNA recombinase
MTPAGIRSAVAYVRGDAAERADQSTTCEAIAHQYDCRIGHIFEDEPSPVRPGHRESFARLCRAVEGGEVEVVIATRVDRLFRGAPENDALWRALAASGTHLITPEIGEVAVDATGAGDASVRRRFVEAFTGTGTTRSGRG